MEDPKDIASLLLEQKWEASFYQIVEQYSERLFRCAVHILGDDAAAQDAIQEAFISIWNNLHSFKGNSAPFTWCYSIVRNQSLRDLKKMRRRGHSLPLEALYTRAADQELAWDAERIEAQVQKSMGKLPEVQRMVFEMRHLHEMSFQEISALLGTSVGGLKASYHHAKKKVERDLTFELNKWTPTDSHRHGQE